MPRQGLTGGVRFSKRWLTDPLRFRGGAIDQRKAMIVELRYFGGFTLEEVAEILDVSPATIDREWRFARSWLKREIGYGING